MTQATSFEPYPFDEGLTGTSLREFFVWCARKNVSDIHIQGGNPLVVGHHGRLRKASPFVLA
ncbi:plasmid transfer ATPase TraJ, partial [Pseudomonas fluorescens]|nr:plasmid transfer ATPase TraJ [Pseudomonas fluorescens]